MKKLKIWNMMMLAVMTLPILVACGGDDGDDEGGSSITVNLTTADKTDDGYFDGMMYYKITSNSPTEVTVFKAEKTVVKVEIPAYVKIDETSYKCTSISKEAFKKVSGLTSIKIPNSVTSIGDNAFEECSGLTSVNISDIAAWCKISFGESASNPLYDAHHLFLNGVEIKDLVIPNSVTNIGNRAFGGCSGLTSVTIPNSVTSIGWYAFAGCSGLTSVTIPNSVTSIGRVAFIGCSGLTSITIPNSVTSIGGWAFEECSGLTSVHISDLEAWCKISFTGSDSNPLCYAHHLFLNGEEIKDLVIPNSVTSIGNRAFGGCSGLTSVTIPNSVTSIGDRAFGGCTGLTSITIPNSVTTIGDDAFAGCTGLASITIGNSVTSIGNTAFCDCTGLNSVRCKAQTPPNINYYTFYDSYSKATLYIPMGTLNAYKTADGWSYFKNIVEE